MARYRKAVTSALWVQLALVVCYVPTFIMLIVITNRKTYSSHLVVIGGITNILTYFNSTLNPFFYCWKVSKADNPTSTLLSMDLDMFSRSRQTCINQA